MIEFPRHKEYRDSSVEWIKEIPSHWAVKRLKYVAKIEAGQSPHESTYNNDAIGTILINGPVEFSAGELGETIEAKWTTDPKKYVPKGTILFCLRGSTTGRLNIAHKHVSIGRGVAGIIFPNHNNYHSYLILCLANNVRETFRGSTFPSITSQQLGNYNIPVISESEQTRIAAFLDAKTTEIDEAIAKKQRLIELLHEQKAILINQAVTKGLNPSVPMRDSGVPWIGEIPSHWAVLPLKRVISTKITDGPHETPKFFDNGIPFVSAEAAFDGRIHLDKARGLISPETHIRYCSKVKPQKNDIFIVKSGSTTGKVVIVDFDDEFSVWSPLALVRPNDSYFVPQFLFLSLQDSYFQKQVQTQWSQGTQPNISMGDLEKLYVITPPLNEQIRIKESLDLKFSSIHITISKIRAEVKSLLEFKSVLISEAVTGKIKI